MIFFLNWVLKVTRKNYGSKKEKTKSTSIMLEYIPNPKFHTHKNQNQFHESIWKQITKVPYPTLSRTKTNPYDFRNCQFEIINQFHTQSSMNQFHQNQKKKTNKQNQPIKNYLFETVIKNQPEFIPHWKKPTQAPKSTLSMHTFVYSTGISNKKKETFTFQRSAINQAGDMSLHNSRTRGVGRDSMITFDNHNGTFEWAKEMV